MSDSQDDLVAFCLPSVDKLVAAAGDLAPNCKDALSFALTMQCINGTPSGTKKWAQDPACAFWCDGVGM